MRFNVTLTDRELTLVRVACIQRLKELVDKPAMKNSYNETKAMLETTLNLHIEGTENVYDYFEKQLGVSLVEDAQAFRDLPLRSNCGNDCRYAIDIAKALIDLGEIKDKDAIIDEVAHTITVFLFG